MPLDARHRVVRCGECNFIYPPRRRRCTRCGSAERVFAVAPREEIERAGLLQRVPPKELRAPRAKEAPPARPSLREHLLFWAGAWVPELIGRIQRR